MFVQIFINTIITICVGRYCYNSYKKAESEYLRLLYILVVCIWIVPVSIYYLDRYNIPTKLTWANNLDTQNWLSFLGTYSAGIVSAVISAFVLVIVTALQIDRNNEDNIKRDAENLRIQNMPLIKYSFNAYEGCESDFKNLIMTKIDDGVPYHLNVYLKNIGLNNIKKIKVSFESDVFCSNKVEVLGNNSIVTLEKGEEISIKKFFSLKALDAPYKVKVTINYVDVLSNWYEQIIDVKYVATSIFENGGPTGVVNYIVNEEKMVEK